MQNRIARVRELMRAELALILQKDFEFGGALVTIHGVDLTPDLKQAHVYLGIIGREDLHEEALHKLRRNAAAISSRLSKRVILKNTPHLHFKLDTSVERGARVLSIMEEVDRLTPPEKTPGPPGEGR
jgi:ribosome-binding factor A